MQRPAPAATAMRCGLICIWVICKYLLPASRLTSRTCRNSRSSNNYNVSQVYVPRQIWTVAAGRHPRAERGARETVLQGKRGFLWNHGEILWSSGQRPADI